MALPVVLSHDPGADKPLAVPVAALNDIERAYRDGQIDATLANHTAHLQTINGSQERTSMILDDHTRKLDEIGRMLEVIPKIQTVAERQIQAEEVAAALKQKQVDEQTAWDRWRGLVAWTLGSTIALVTITNLTLRIAGIG